MSSTNQYHILIADDDIDILAALKLLLNCEGYDVTIASRPEQAVTLYSENSFDAVLLDLNFQNDTTSGEEGLSLLSSLKKIDPNTPLIVMTGWANISIAVATMKSGAVDFIEKPWDNERVLSIITTQVKLAQQHKINAKLKHENKLLKAQQHQTRNILAHSPAMQQVLKQAEQIAQSDVPILITGENGTGKSLLAQTIHESSTRNSHSMINVNMGAIPESLFESEMFGHVKGAFTDAKENRIGRFELADQGSLFLDEIGNIPLSQQSKLLRVLEEQQFEKVGASKTQHSDARIISATNANISQLIKSSLFRQDLFYRLNGIEIQLPPLRERIEDIIPMAENFLEKYAHKYNKTELSFAPSALSAFQQYSWPGNIRELNHMVERAVILSSNKQLGVELLSLATENIKTSSTTPLNLDSSLTLEAFEEQLIQQRIKEHNGNMQKTAKSLGLSRSAFYRRIDKYKI